MAIWFWRALVSLNAPINVMPHYPPPGHGRTYIGVKKQILPLDLKGRFYAINVFRQKRKILRQSLCFVLNGNILHKESWRIFPCV